MKKAELILKVEQLQAFKDYVHKRLDDAGIFKYPNGEHSKNGCRIGDRLDLVLNPNLDLVLENPENDRLQVKQTQILKDFKSWSGGYHPSEVSDEKIEEYVDNCLYGKDNEDEELKSWLYSLNK